MKKKWISSFLFCLITVCSKAQTEGYHYYANLDSIKNSGFYKIALDPELNAHIKTNFSDVRIVNAAGKWIPHILNAPNDLNTGRIIYYNIQFEKTINSSASTELILNGGDRFIAGFDINVKSTSASRVAKLSGSDNRQDWFVILDSLLLTPLVIEKKGETKYHIDFPACNYKYYKLVIDNKANDPVNILHITMPVQNYTGVTELLIAENPGAVIFQKDSGRISYIKMTQKENYHIDQLGLTTSGVKYYYRKMEIYLPSGDNHAFSNPGTLLQSFYLTNKNSLYYNLRHINPKVLYLLIYNEDNLPLKIDAVKSWSNTRWLTAYLEKGTQYKLIMDNPFAMAPDYDLTKLNNIIPDSLLFLHN